MSILSKFIYDKTIPREISAIGSVLDKLFTSDDERAHAQIVLEKLKQYPEELQIALNQEEAKHRSLLVAGWRPFIGWICGAGLANTFIINPWIQWLTGMVGPQLPLNVIMELVLSLLGLGTLRTVEKFGGKTK